MRVALGRRRRHSPASSSSYDHPLFPIASIEPPSQQRWLLPCATNTHTHTHIREQDGARSRVARHRGQQAAGACDLVRGAMLVEDGEGRKRGRSRVAKHPNCGAHGGQSAAADGAWWAGLCRPVARISSGSPPAQGICLALPFFSRLPLRILPRPPSSTRKRTLARTHARSHRKTHRRLSTSRAHHRLSCKTRP